MSAFDPRDPYGDASYRFFKEQLKQRVKPKRYRHSKGVAKTARLLAETYGHDPRKARAAGILHDWDKGLSRDEVIARAAELCPDIDAALAQGMPWLLHGPTAAAALAREYPELGAEVTQAIARHTTGAVGMTPLDQIVYVADVIEPNRVIADGSGLACVRASVGQVPLDELYFLTFKYNMQFLVGYGRPLNPGTIDVWNDLAARYGHIRNFK